MEPETGLRWLARVARVLSAPFVRFDIAGAEELNHQVDELVIAVNHRSLYDVAAGLIVFHRYGRYPRVLIEQKYVDTTWTRPLARAIGAIPVDRAAGRGEAFRAAAQALDAGATIVILPEGRLHWDPDDPLATGRPATGVSRLAEVAGAPVVCAGMVGTEQVWPADRRLPRLRPGRRRVVTVRIADQLIELDGDDHRERAEQVMAAVRQQMAVALAAAQAEAVRRRPARGRPRRRARPARRRARAPGGGSSPRTPPTPG